LHCTTATTSFGVAWQSREETQSEASAAIFMTGLQAVSRI
jgi:hypothetical protein